MNIVKARVKSAMASKVNWTQIIGIAAQVGAYMGVDVPPEQQTQIAVVLAATTGIVTWVQRTWFTSSITAASAKRSGLH